MIYYTGDIHGSPTDIVLYAEEQNLSKDDVLVLLGDVGANYYGNHRDNICKADLATINTNFK